jgi:hypothetical protein
VIEGLEKCFGLLAGGFLGHIFRVAKRAGKRQIWWCGRKG